MKVNKVHPAEGRLGPRRKDNFQVAKSSQKGSGTESSSGSFLVTPADKQKTKGNNQYKSKDKRSKKCEEEGTLKKNTKKPFDKKTYRLKKYSKKYKIDQWEQKRKRTVLNEYYKQIKNDNTKSDVQKIYEQYDEEEKEGSSSIQEENDNENNLNEDLSKNERQKTNRKKVFRKSHEEFQRVREENARKMEEIEKKKAERAEIIKQQKLKRLERNKLLNQKTRKGQPIMKHRMEMLLEQIQRSLE